MPTIRRFDYQRYARTAQRDGIYRGQWHESGMHTPAWDVRVERDLECNAQQMIDGVRALLKATHSVGRAHITADLLATADR